MTKEKRKLLRGLVLRIALCLVLALILWGVLAMFLDQVSEGTWEKDTGRMVSICDRYYYDRNYAELRDELELFDEPVVPEELVLEESEASVEVASSLSDSLFVD